MTTYFAGQPLTAAQMEDLRTFATPLMVVKTADESVTSSIAPQNDNELLVSVAANASYQMTMHLIVFSTGTANDLLFQFNAPAGSRMTASALGVASNATTVTGEVNAGGFANVTTFPTEPKSLYATVNSTIGVLCYGTLIVGATAGNLQLMWAQGTSSATATTIKAGSSMQLVRYA